MNAAALSEYNYVVVVDASGSMAEPNKSGTRWSSMQENLIGFARDLATVNEDGFTLITFGGSKIDTVPSANADKVREVFANRQPHGGTPLDAALQAALTAAGKTSKKAFVAIFTDGVPDDEDAAARVIVNFTKTLTDDSKDRVKILFVQVGNDPHATKYLDKLDNALPGAKYDIVNAKSAEAVNKFDTTTDLITSAILDQH